MQKPLNFENQLEIVFLSLEQGTFSPALLEEIGLLETLSLSESDSINFERLLDLLPKILQYPDAKSVELLKVSLVHITDIHRFLEIIYPILSKLAYQDKHIEYAIDLTQICLQLGSEDDLFLLGSLYALYTLARNYLKAGEIIERIFKSSPDFDIQLYGKYLALDLSLKQGNFLEIESLSSQYKEAIESIDLIITKPINPVLKQFLPSLTHLLFYIEDNPRQIRTLQNKLSQIYQNSLTNINIHQAKRSQDKLKIGYISCNLRRHSIGWLSRWLLHYHDREKLEVYLYLINQNEDDITDKWFVNKDNFVHRLDEHIPAIVQQIQEDQLDILVDLESMTSPTICWVMALKPAPIQITWLGLDSTGLPSIDYFLVDPHVVPADAQQYYQEKLWRLTPSYLAVDGFEIGLANLTRKDLNIPDDAVIYLTSQSGYKRHLEMIKMQLTILKKVPNSYLLVKGFANKDIIKELFEKLAQEQNVPLENLRFLTFDTNEETHRANLQLADVILDTYPYNGATTTLEVLWLGIPIVTLVGAQFAARNSYTFMLNAGITEGIAFNAQEYIDWGIKLGTSEDLRSKIHWKLWNSRQNAPLWNAQQFTKTVEDAYLAIARP